MLSNAQKKRRWRSLDLEPVSTSLLKGNDIDLNLYPSEGFKIIETKTGRLSGNELFPATEPILKLDDNFLSKLFYKLKTYSLKVLPEKTTTTVSQNWRDISYLRTGNDKQRRVYEVLFRHNVLAILQDFDPAVVSTICVGLDTPRSDIDIICYAPDLSKLERILRNNYSEDENFFLQYHLPKDESLVCSFRLEEFEIEVFDSLDTIESQPAYRHLSVMKRLVGIGDETFQKDIIELKDTGLKTEPAIARRLRLPGDPYRAVLELENASDSDLIELSLFCHSEGIK